MPHHPHHPAPTAPPVSSTRLAAPVAATVATYTFADDFAGTAGSPPNSSNWQYQTGPGSVVGGNDETETYVDSTDNAYLDGDGHLVIAVTNASGGGFNSARLISKYHLPQYGTWEVCAAITNSPGCWPAIWFMGIDGSWPGCGEADLMEGYGTGFTDGTLWDTTATASVNGISANPSDNNFHVYRIVSAENSIQYFRDNVQYLSATPKNLSPWPFNTNGGLYATLNIATDGTGTNGVSPSASAMPVEMLVEYVHAWA